MYPNPYQNNNNNNGGYSYPPPSTPPQPQQQGYPPPSAYPPFSAPYSPQTSYQPGPPPQSPGGGGMMYPSFAQQPGGPYGAPPPAAGGMYPPPPGTPSGNPFGAHVTAPYGMPQGMPDYGPTPSPMGIPHAMPTPSYSYGQPPQQQHQQQQAYPGSPPSAMSPPFTPVPSMAPQFQQQHQQQQQQQHQQYQQQQHQPDPSTSSTFKFQCGPLLRYQNMDLQQGHWIGSVMMVSMPEAYGQAPPALTWSDGRAAPQHVMGQAIDQYKNAVFWRFALVIPQDMHGTKKISYSINHGPNYWFFVPGRSESFRWMFYSCNGFSSSVDGAALGGANPLWKDVLEKHTEQPYHVMIGGGDQLYCDGVLAVPEMMEWLAISSVEEREKIQVSSNWSEAIENYYFNRYCTWFSQGSYGQALAAIPSVNMWDDHDTVDGYGSYPESTQKSPVMSRIGAVSRRFYLLFQQHTTSALVPQHGFFSAGVGESILTSMGPSASLLVLDARSERTKSLICSDQTYDLAFAKMYNEIPQGTRHLLVQLGVPIAYPRLVFAENLMGSVGTVLGNIAGAKNVVNKLNGEPELLDDLNDHWTAKLHKAERNKFLTRLQNFANDRKIRVTFISGDVHCAGVGRFTAKVAPPEKDPQLMYQVISSAIVNEPPPEGVIKLLHFQDKTHILEGRIKTYEDMYPMFTQDVDGKPLQMDKLMPRRNYSHGHFNHHTGGMEITIFVENIRGGPEHTPGSDKGTKPYAIHVPRLEA